MAAKKGDSLDPSDPEQFTAQVRNLINGEGYALEAALLHLIPTLPQKNGGSWQVRAGHFPVKLADQEFHVDGVLEWAPNPGSPEAIYIALECKRKDPRYTDWFFATSSELPRQVVIDVFRTRENTGPSVEAFALDAYGIPVADTAFERKIRDNAISNGLEVAVTQALRGAGGLMGRIDEFLGKNRSVRIVPVVVTTNDLYLWTEELRRADPITGTLATGEPIKQELIWLQRHVSRSLLANASRSRIRYQTEGNPLPYIALHEHRRAVLVTTTRGLNAALHAIADQTGRAIP